jgi:hypothetical protein
VKREISISNQSALVVVDCVSEKTRKSDALYSAKIIYEGVSIGSGSSNTLVGSLHSAEENMGFANKLSIQLCLNTAYALAEDLDEINSAPWYKFWVKMKK